MGAVGGPVEAGGGPCVGSGRVVRGSGRGRGALGRGRLGARPFPACGSRPSRCGGPCLGDLARGLRWNRAALPEGHGAQSGGSQVRVRRRRDPGVQQRGDWATVAGALIPWAAGLSELTRGPGSAPAPG